jgi:hypothetical protein
LAASFTQSSLTLTSEHFATFDQPNNRKGVSHGKAVKKRSS